MARNFTRELRKAHRRGVNKVVCSLAPWDGREVAYMPRGEHDPLPWVFLHDQPQEVRFNGRECRIQSLGASRR
jgi:hypothetical protein